MSINYINKIININKNKKKILIVDDEELNVKILKLDLIEEGYQISVAFDGVQAVKILRQDSNFDVILLDRMMPNMDGMEVLKIIKSDPILAKIPVIMQTAASTEEQILEGIQAGVFYYLTKPFKHETLLAIVASSIKDKEHQTFIENEVARFKNSLGLMEMSSFSFRTPEEAQSLAYLLASFCPNPERAASGILEMMFNAIEHGNLEIDYNQKKQLLFENRWLDEINKRLADPLYKERRAKIQFQRNEDNICLCIIDQGKGFNWMKFMSFAPERATDPNGRGILMAKQTCFNNIEYIAPGNVVYCTINL